MLRAPEGDPAYLAVARVDTRDVDFADESHFGWFVGVFFSAVDF
jgi:hypothetical protein